MLMRRTATSKNSPTPVSSTSQNQIDCRLRVSTFVAGTRRR